MSEGLRLYPSNVTHTKPVLKWSSSSDAKRWDRTGYLCTKQMDFSDAWNCCIPV